MFNTFYPKNTQSFTATKTQTHTPTEDERGKCPTIPHNTAAAPQGRIQVFAQIADHVSLFIGPDFTGTMLETGVCESR